MSDFFIKQNDRLPLLSGTLKDGAGTAVDISGATVKFLMRYPNGKTIINSTDVVIDSATGGQVSYNWSTSDTNRTGDYEGEFEVTFTGGKVETFPNTGWIKIRITEDLG